MIHRIKNWFDRLLCELFTVREPISEVSFSFALGVFLGILPFTGVAAALALAWVFRLNKAAAILGSAITNTWMGLIVLGLSIKAAVTFSGINGEEVHQEISHLWHHFEWHALFQSSFVKLIGPVAIAFVIISFIFACFGFAIAYGVIYWHRRHQKLT